MNYSKKKAKFLELHPVCPVFGTPTVEIHHQRGRLGRLCNDERFWVAVSRAGHQWIHEHPSEARAKGLLCAMGEWSNLPQSPMLKNEQRAERQQCEGRFYPEQFE